MRALNRRLIFSNFLLFVLIGLTIIIIRFAGGLQFLELKFFDLLFQLDPARTLPEPQVVLVGYTETDIQRLGEPVLSDATLERLLRQIRKHNPRYVGLDFFRDSRIDPSLMDLFRDFENLFLPARLLGDPAELILPPAAISRSRWGDVSVPVDLDGVVRRGFLWVCSQRNEDKKCQEYEPSLPMQLAQAYLEEEGIQPRLGNQNRMQLVNQEFPMVKPFSGGYIQVSSGGGYQILRTWRVRKFPTVSVINVLNDNIPSSFFRDRIVLVGSLAESQQDLFYTPFSSGIFQEEDQIYGVQSLASLTQQILNAALLNLPNLWTVLDWIEYLVLWVVLALGLLTFYFWYFLNRHRLLFKFLIVNLCFIMSLFLLSCGLFQWAYIWFPFIPYAVGLVSSLSLSSFLIADYERHLYIIHLEEESNLLRRELDVLYQQHIVWEKKDSVSFLGAKLAHEIRNLLGIVDGNRQLCSDLCSELKDLYGDDEEWEEFSSLLDNMGYNINRISVLVNEVLSHSRDSEQKPVPVAVNLNHFLEQVLAQAIQPQSQQICSIYRDYDPSLNSQTIPILPSILERALINMFQNSLYALSQKSYHSELPYIKLATRNYDNFIEIDIIDNGIGIDPEYCDQIFDLLFTCKPRGLGTGLGLYLVFESIVKLHRGSIRLEDTSNEEPSCTHFVIALPKVFRSSVLA